MDIISNWIGTLLGLLVLIFENFLRSIISEVGMRKCSFCLDINKKERSLSRKNKQTHQKDVWQNHT